MASDYSSLPPDLPEPRDDGATDHLEGMKVPAFGLESTTGKVVDLSALSGLTVVYVFPMIGRPGDALPAGWDDFPGARGCTPESCGFRDRYPGFEALGSRILGLSSSGLERQLEAKNRLDLPFELLADPGFSAAETLRLPTFGLDGGRYYKRMTMIIADGTIRKVFYPVFPPDLHPTEVEAWLEQEALRLSRYVPGRPQK